MNQINHGEVETWKVSLPCTRAEAELLNDDDLFVASSDSTPTIVARELDSRHPDQWVIDVYCESPPDQQFLLTIAELSPSAKAANIAPTVEKIDAEDWITLSQQGLQPLRAGRFYVYTSDNPPSDDRQLVNIRIDASRAFGTGHHETTSGCLIALDQLKRRGKHFRNIIDVGTGTGLLAFAAHNLWPHAKLIASDIDPIAIEVSRTNAAANRLTSRDIRFVVSNGLDHQAIGRRAPYDLVIANILAGPLIALAPQIASAASAGTVLILAGLLKRQQPEVVAAFLTVGFRLATARMDNDWPCLTLVKAKKYGWSRPQRREKSPLAADYFGEI